MSRSLSSGRSTSPGNGVTIEDRWPLRSSQNIRENRLKESEERSPSWEKNREGLRVTYGSSYIELELQDGGSRFNVTIAARPRQDHDSNEAALYLVNGTEMRSFTETLSIVDDALDECFEHEGYTDKNEERSPPQARPPPRDWSPQGLEMWTRHQDGEEGRLHLSPPSESPPQSTLRVPPRLAASVMMRCLMPAILLDQRTLLRICIGSWCSSASSDLYKRILRNFRLSAAQNS